jgi:hypothetical protein
MINRQLQECTALASIIIQKLKELSKSRERR